jgi:homospermidine synthase
MNMKIVLIGFGAVAKCLLTLLPLSPLKDNSYKITIIEPKDITNSEVYNTLKNKIEWIQEKVTKANYIQLFDKYIENNSIVIELSYRTETSDMLTECDKRNCLYINTAIDVWSLDSPFSVKPTNKRFKDSLVEIKEKILQKNKNHKTTAVLNHGFNPGIVSHLVKDLLKKLTSSSGVFSNEKLYNFCNHGKYNIVAESLGLTLIQIAERDTQYSNTAKTSEKNFVNTWSVVGLIDECFDPVQLTWGTHEKKLCIESDLTLLKQYNQIVLKFWGSTIRTLSYEPTGGKFTGTCIPHAESYSLAKFLRTPSYCPSIYYSYMMGNDAKLIFKLRGIFNERRRFTRILSYS